MKWNQIKPSTNYTSLMIKVSILSITNIVKHQPPVRGYLVRSRAQDPQWSPFVWTIHCEAGTTTRQWPWSPALTWTLLTPAQRLMDLFFVSWNWNRLLLINLVRTRFLCQYFYLKLSGKTEKYIHNLKPDILEWNCTTLHPLILSPLHSWQQLDGKSMSPALRDQGCCCWLRRYILGVPVARWRQARCWGVSPCIYSYV